MLKNRLEQFKKRQRDDAVKATETASRIKMEEVAAAAAAEAEGVLPEQEDVDEDDWVEEYEPEMSPEPVDITQMTLDDRRSRVVDEMEHVHAIVRLLCTLPLHKLTDKYAARHALVDSVRAKALSEMHRETSGNQHHTSRTVAQASAADLETERMIRAEAQYENDLESDQSENEFGDLDDALDLSTGKPQQLDYSDRYRPRKPRYFNRVHTGYEWNRYNQMHYEYVTTLIKRLEKSELTRQYGEPAAKGCARVQVQRLLSRSHVGRILSGRQKKHELISSDKSTAPTYRLQKDPSDPDTQIIVFTAGPPYEDIAFRIVRKPWEYSHRRGFRSTFDRGVLQREWAA